MVELLKSKYVQLTNEFAPIAYNVDKFQSVIKAVAEFILRKAIFEHVIQDNTNKTYLGNVQFWFEYTILSDKTKINPMLTFSLQPAFWNFDAILRDIQYQEHIIDSKIHGIGSSRY